MTKNRQWYYGDLVAIFKDVPCYGILISWDKDMSNCIPVKKKTVGQFTGLKDNQENEIYEGDYLNIGPFDLGCITNGEGEKVKYEVRLDGCDYILYRQDLNLTWGRLSRLGEMGWDCQVIGNIHE